MINNSVSPLKFKARELAFFNWIYGVAPCFPVKASNINIITDPRKFYDTLCDRFKDAANRISVASLYVGTGPLEKNLLELTNINLAQNKNLNMKVLLDYQRGTRGNSQVLLQNILKQFSDQCNIALYQTPRLQNSWSRVLPARYNELIGLQHMKLYITDDTVIISGANVSNDYFQQRQDRYIEIKNADLANFYSELIDEVCTYSHKCSDSGVVKNKISKGVITKEMNRRITDLINRWKTTQESKLKNTIVNNDDSADTWVFPLIQMGEFNIRQDEEVTKGILVSVPKGSYVRLATGYFNLTEDYSKVLLKNSKSNISLLMAHPNANGFMGASGPAGGIPHAYSLIARQFWQKVQHSNQASRIWMLEYERQGWTFHAKGLWYYPAGYNVPFATVVGSANLGERSVRRDVEAQAAIFTVSPELQQKLHYECSSLHQYASECTKHLDERKTPLWVRATVGLFRTYF